MIPTRLLLALAAPPAPINIGDHKQLVIDNKFIGDNRSRPIQAVERRLNYPACDFCI